MDINGNLEGHVSQFYNKYSAFSDNNDLYKNDMSVKNEQAKNQEHVFLRK